ncbi:MAG: signal recognition particle protein [Pseudomonadota bacterium]|nr:signal recognition particle protein [Pseudomonadota bacterium]
MFDSLGQRLGNIFDRLRGRGVLSAEDVEAALREVRIALLEADVALPVARDFVARVREKAVGQEVLRSITPGQQVVKIVHDALVEMLGGTVGQPGLDLNVVPPVPVMMVGLQGSGKTTTTGKLALWLKNRERKKVLMASLDVYRPAAQDQLRILGEQTGVDTLPVIADQKPVDIARRAMETGRTGGYDVVLLDTAGRLAIDDVMMAEAAAVRDAVKPHETLLVVDAMTGQDALTVATEFRDKVGLTGIVMTRMDGDARGGSALSMRAVTGQPLRFIGVGEKTDALEPFHPERVAGRILGMGDVVSLVEKAMQTVDQDEALKMAEKVQKGNFDLNDLAAQLRQMRKMGGIGGLLNMLPGMGKIKDQLGEKGVDEKILVRQESIILSMTPGERRDPDIIKASRKRRIALGAGVTVNEINQLLKQHDQMRDMMRQMKKMGKKGLMRGGLSALFGGDMSSMLSGLSGIQGRKP